MRYIKIKNWGKKTYEYIYSNMIIFTKNRILKSPDQIWIMEHYPIFTQGRNRGLKNIKKKSFNIPIIKSDRGGQITYHGPGQIIIYLLFNLKRLNVSSKYFINIMEKSCIDLLKKYNIKSNSIKNAPGVYVKKKKIASIGLRIKKGNTYHGIAINNYMDTYPFKRINPCGYKNLGITQIKEHKKILNISHKNKIQNEYVKFFFQKFNK